LLRTIFVDKAFNVFGTVPVMAELASFGKRIRKQLTNTRRSIGAKSFAK